MQNDADKKTSGMNGGSDDSTPFHKGPMELEDIRDAVGIANVPALLMLVYQFTGEAQWLEPPYCPTRGKGLLDHDNGGLSEEVQLEIRHAAIDAIGQLQSGKAPAILAPSPELVVRMMSVFMGEDVGPEYGPMLSSEFALPVRHLTRDDVV